MSNERMQILTMLKDGKISVEEAEKLLIAVGEEKESAGPKADGVEPPKNLKYLRIIEKRESAGEEGYEKHLNIRIPLALLRAGAKLHSVLPEDVREKIDRRLQEKLGDLGANLLDGRNMDLVIKTLSEEGIEIEIDRPDKKISVFCE